MSLGPLLVLFDMADRGTGSPKGLGKVCLENGMIWSGCLKPVFTLPTLSSYLHLPQLLLTFNFFFPPKSAGHGQCGAS